MEFLDFTAPISMVRAMHLREHSVFQSRLENATQPQQLVTLAREFLATWSPQELAMIPAECRPGPIRDVGDISEVAFNLVHFRCEAGSMLDGIEELAAFFSHAAARAAQLAHRSP